MQYDSISITGIMLDAMIRFCSCAVQVISGGPRPTEISALCRRIGHGFCTGFYVLIPLGRTFFRAAYCGYTGLSMPDCHRCKIRVRSFHDPLPGRTIEQNNEHDSRRACSSPDDPLNSDVAFPPAHEFRIGTPHDLAFFYLGHVTNTATTGYRIPF